MEVYNQAWIVKPCLESTEIVNRIDWFNESELKTLKNGWQIKELYPDTCRILEPDKDGKIKVLYINRAHLS